MGLLSYSPGCDTLEIKYPSANVNLKEGDPLTLNCTVWYEQEQSSDLKVYWCKQVENQSSCARVGKELERLLSTESLNPQARVSLSLLLEIHNVSHSDSGGYQCKASANNQIAIGHYIRVKVTGKQW
uniref:Ig-like domain-containing protein n=1 Tax=Terrapene triunguis TaxID=2587831 RepID=A0A674IAW6_9SAUR